MILFSFCVYNILIWNSFRYEKNILIETNSNLNGLKFIYSIIAILIITFISFLYNYALILNFNKEELKNLYYDGKIFIIFSKSNLHFNKYYCNSLFCD